REARDDDAALEGDALGRASEDIAADGVVDDIRSTSACERLDPLSEVLGLVVDGVVGSELPAQLDFRVGPGRGDDRRSGGLAKLDGGAADPTRARVHEQRLARQQVGTAMQAEPAGLVR